MDIENRLKTFIEGELLDGKTVDIDENLLADGMVDSLGMLRLVTHIEDLMDIKIPHSDLVIENFRTIAVVNQYLEGRKAT